MVHLTSVRDAHDDIVRAIRCDALGSGAFYTAGYDRAVCAFDPETLNPASRDKPHVRGKPRFRRFPNLHDAPIVSLDFDQDNGWIVTGSLDGTVRVFTRDARRLNSFEPDGIARVLSVARLPGASAYLSAGVAEDGDETRAVISCFDARTPLELTERVADACGFVTYPASRLTPSEHDPTVAVPGSIRRARSPGTIRRGGVAIQPRRVVSRPRGGTRGLDRGVVRGAAAARRAGSPVQRGRGRPG